MKAPIKLLVEFKFIVKIIHTYNKLKTTSDIAGSTVILKILSLN